MTAGTLPPLAIIVVEDNEDMAQSTAELLSLYGCRVRIARQAGEVPMLVAAEPADAVLIEPQLAGAWDVIRQLRQKEKPPLLVAITCFGNEHARRQSADAGIDQHLVKPVDPAVLIDILRQNAPPATRE
jgi:DNA-binding response OmpR family regulator